MRCRGISTRQQPNNTRRYRDVYQRTASTQYKEMQGVYQPDSIQTIQGDAGAYINKGWRYRAYINETATRQYKEMQGHKTSSTMKGDATRQYKKYKEMQGRISTRQQSDNTRRCRDVYHQRDAGRISTRQTENKEMQGRISKTASDNTRRCKDRSTDSIQAVYQRDNNETGATREYKEIWGAYINETATRQYKEIQGRISNNTRRQQSRQYKERCKGVYQRNGDASSIQTIQGDAGANTNQIAT
ncbi:unnamed protein product [Mytilus coruscus]|uniref:Uncharacterized protein n=1 Tax=Mytilus coruscus TaxID=42192 RepID=A0A6J8AKB8_MYTCO|nr:unnamed protein product [Mytilus coruscus]